MNYIFYGLLSALFAALVALFGKLGLTQFDTVLATTLRSGIMLFSMLMFSVALGRFDSIALKQLPWSSWGWLIAAGVAGACSWLFYFEGLAIGPMAKLVALDRLSLVFAVMLSTLVLGEPMTLKLVIGMILMVIGSLFMIR